MSVFGASIRFGVIISICLIAFFLILSLFGLHTNPVFSLFNGIIVGVGIFEAIRNYKQRTKEDFLYEKGFSVGLFSGFIASLIFTIFFLFYATEINSLFISNLLSVFDRGYSVSVGLVTFVVAIMGLATTVVLTLTSMQFFKKSRNIPLNA